MHTIVYTITYTHTVCTQPHTSTVTRTHVCLQSHTHLHTHAHKHTHVHMHTHACTCTVTCIHSHTHMCAHSHTCVHTVTHTLTHNPTRSHIATHTHWTNGDRMSYSLLSLNLPAEGASNTLRRGTDTPQQPVTRTSLGVSWELSRGPMGSMPPLLPLSHSCTRKSEIFRYKSNKMCAWFLGWTLQDTDERNPRRPKLMETYTMFMG